MPEKTGKKTVFRTGISLEPELLEKFDKWIEEKKFPNRSDAIRFLIREQLIKSNLQETPEIKASETKVMGTFTFIYNHHRFESSSKLTEMQHDYNDVIVTTVHIHASHDYCLEVLLLSGEYRKIKQIAEDLLCFKGVIHGHLYVVPFEELIED